jgi:hypothetical protein
MSCRSSSLSGFVLEATEPGRVRYIASCDPKDNGRGLKSAMP